MKIKNRKVATIAIALGLLGSLTTIPAANAETFVFQSGPLTNLDAAGSTVNGGFASFPAGAGLYIQQCVAPVGTARPATCSDTIQLWISDSAQPGTTSSKGAIAIKVMGLITGKGTVVDCTLNSCGLFFRLDHTKPTDTSEDKFMPITFRTGSTATALAADEVTVTFNGVRLARNVSGELAYQAPGRVVATTKSGLPVTLTSLNENCSYRNGLFTALKGEGQCALGHSTSGDKTTAASVANYPFILVPGVQKISGLPKTLKVKSSKQLPIETNFGVAISYQALGKKCSVSNGLVKLQKIGRCSLQATAPAKAGLWKELSTKVKIIVTKA